jgi:hypothetical protein
MMRSFRGTLLAIIAVAGVWQAGPIRAEEKAAEKPAEEKKEEKTDLAAIEIRAIEAFNRGEYTIALPLLQKVKQALPADDERLGPIDERIRLAQRNLAKQMKEKGLTIPPTTGLPDDPPSSAEKRKPHAPPKEGEVRTVTIKLLGNFDYDQENGGNIPSDVKRLAGSVIRVNGYMIPMDQADNITKFALVPDLFACCFGAPPQIQHSLTVVCPKGKAVNYSPDEIVVEGVLKVEEQKEDGFILGIFELEARSVKPAAK